MDQKRSRTEIIADMLEAIQLKQGKIKPTHLMYKANLSYGQLKTYLDDLIDKELVQELKTPKDTQYFLLTDKGFKFLQKLQEMKQFEKSFGF